MTNTFFKFLKLHTLIILKPFLFNLKTHLQEAKLNLTSSNI